MCKTKPEIAIGKRAFEEILRIFETLEKAKNVLGIRSKGLIYDWMAGVAPSAKYLQRLHLCGADVIYILTGVRKNELPKM